MLDISYTNEMHVILSTSQGANISCRLMDRLVRQFESSQR